jgi:hypothetical protein
MEAASVYPTKHSMLAGDAPVCLHTGRRHDHFTNLAPPVGGGMGIPRASLGPAPSPAPVLAWRGQSQCTLMELGSTHRTICAMSACELPCGPPPSEDARSPRSRSMQRPLPRGSRMAPSEPMHVDGGRVNASSEVCRAGLRDSPAESRQVLAASWAWPFAE